MVAMPETGPWRDWGVVLIVVGLLVAAAGAALLFLDRLPGLGRLPGDVVIERGRWTFLVPITTMIVVSIVLTLLLNLFLRR
jgi:hypothetical protein